jgi:hypothetical protein
LVITKAICLNCSSDTSVRNEGLVAALPQWYAEAMTAEKVKEMIAKAINRTEVAKAQVSVTASLEPAHHGTEASKEF